MWPQRQTVALKIVVKRRSKIDKLQFYLTILPETKVMMNFAAARESVIMVLKQKK